MSDVVHVSDLHFGTESDVLVEALLADLVAVPPALVAISGDLTQRATSEQFKAARAFLGRIEQLGIAALVVPGNHDVPLYDLASRFLRPFARYTEHITRDLAPTFVNADLAVAGITTAYGGLTKNGKISAVQAAAACKLFGAYPSHWKLVVAHHPFEVAHGAAEVVEGAEDALARFERADTDVILTGHLHIAHAAQPAERPAAHDIISVHAGTAISSRLRGEANGYNRLAFSPQAVSVIHRAWDGTAFADVQVQTFARHAKLAA